MVPRRGIAPPAARSADPAMPRIGKAFRLVTANDNKASAAARVGKWAALAILVLLAAALAAALS
jgi:hypothetical protein